MHRGVIQFRGRLLHHTVADYGRGDRHPVIDKVRRVLEAGAGVTDVNNPDAKFEAKKELWTLYEVIAQCLTQILPR